MRLIILSLLLSFFSFNGFSSNIVGGEVGYECVGPRTWKIKLTLYRNCSGATLCSSAANCTQAMVAKPNATLNPSNCVASPNQVNFNVNFTRVEDLGLSNQAICGSAAKNACTNMGNVLPGNYNPSIEKYEFEGTLNLNLPTLNIPNTCAYWDVYWEMCCRPSGIINLINSSNLGYRIGATINIFWQSGVTCANSSPQLRNEAVAILCSGQESYLNMGAVDLDNDSISYEIAPAKGLGGINVIYQSPFSSNYPFPLNSTSVPHINYPQPFGPYIIIDSTSGTLGVNAVNNSPASIYGNVNVIIKQWNYSVNGLPILVGVTQRDLNIFVIPCLNNNPPRFATNPSLAFGRPKLNHSVWAGENLCFTVTAKDTDFNPNIPIYDTTFISWNQAIVRPGKVSFAHAYPLGSRPREDVWQFCWETEESDVRTLPYSFVVSAIDNRCPNPGRIQSSFSIKVLSKLKFSKSKSDLGCGINKFTIYKSAPFQNLSYATLQISNHPNDINFNMGVRNVNPISINPIGTTLDSIGQPRIMFTDSFRYTQPGKYYIKFDYMIDGIDILVSVIDSIEIKQDSLLNPIISSNQDTFVCYGESTLLQTNLNNPKYRFQWQKNDSGLVNETSNRLIVNSSGKYKLQILDTTLGCYSYSNIISILVGSKLNTVLSHNGNRFICSGDSLFVSAKSDKEISFQWLNNGTQIVGAVDSSIFIKQEGVYQLITFDSSGCRDTTEELVVTLNDNPVAIISSTSGNLFCAGDSVTLTSVTGAKFKYQWMKSNVNIIGAIDSSCNVTQSGDYQVIITDSNGCFKKSNTITLVEKSNPVIISSKDAKRCGIGELVLSANSNVGVVQWYDSQKGGNLLDTGTFFTTTNLQNTRIFYAQGVFNGCFSKPRTPIVAEINKFPIIGLIAGQRLALDSNLIYDYNVNQQLNHTYEWEITNGNIIMGQGSNFIKVQWLSSGIGNLKCKITNDDGCSDSTSIQINIIRPSPVIFSFNPTTAPSGSVVNISGNNFINVNAVKFGGVNARNFTVINNTTIIAIVDTGATGDLVVATPSGNASLPGFIYQSNTGIKETVLEDVIVYPNPVTSQLFIELNQSMSIVNFEVRDVAGKLVRSSIIPAGYKATMVDLSDLTSSVYLLHLRTDNGVKTIKLIKY